LYTLPGRWVVLALGFAAGLLAATHTPADFDNRGFLTAVGTLLVGWLLLLLLIGFGEWRRVEGSGQADLPKDDSQPACP
jgi:hypothetical protein